MPHGNLCICITILLNAMSMQHVTELTLSYCSQGMDEEDANLLLDMHMAAGQRDADKLIIICHSEPGGLPTKFCTIKNYRPSVGLPLEVVLGACKVRPDCVQVHGRCQGHCTRRPHARLLGWGLAPMSLAAPCSRRTGYRPSMCGAAMGWTKSGCPQSFTAQFSHVLEWRNPSKLQSMPPQPLSCSASDRMACGFCSSSGGTSLDCKP
jgi:hypothetical protein